ncbi:MAG: HypC/HybG/HupF family hydrogenase formation chaperone [Nitrospiraceae bacterium]|nr:HypC/HybG/HupF family hydrogenase formation chaperone [Nitrospiraceae bacterium]
MCLGIPGKVLEIQGDDPLYRTAKVSFGGAVKEVSLAALPEVNVDEYVIVHAGLALSTLNEEEAQEVFDALEEMAE